MAYCRGHEFDAPSFDREPCTYTRHIFRSPIQRSRNRFTGKWLGCRWPTGIQRETSCSYGRMRNKKSMIGLWGASMVYGRQNGVLTRCHLAFAVSFEQLQRAIIKLNERGIETSGSGGKPTTELSVIGWMPSAQIYFRDPDAHSLEFIAILPEAPNASFVG